MRISACFIDAVSDTQGIVAGIAFSLSLAFAFLVTFGMVSINILL